MSYDLPVRRSQQIGSAFTVATLPNLSQMVGEPIGMLAYTVDGGLYAWNGTTWVAVAAGAAIALGTTPITGGTSGYVLYDNAGLVGELANTGTGNNVLANSPALITPSLDVATGISLALSSATGLTLGGSVLAKTNTLLFTPVSYYIAPSSTATTISVTGASWTSGVATLTFSAITTKLPVGTVITVTGITPSGYNVSNVQITASTTTSVSYAVVSNPGAYSSGGTIGNGTTYTPTSGAVIIDILVGGGGGGGGGGVVNATAVSGGAAGGGAGAAGRRLRVSELGGSASITLGVGGASGGVGVAGSVGGTTSFTSNSPSYVISGFGGGGGYFGGVATTTGGGGGGGGTINAGGSGTISAGGLGFQGGGSGGFAAVPAITTTTYVFSGAPGTGGGGGAAGLAGNQGGNSASGNATGGGSGGGSAAVSGGSGGLSFGNITFGGSTGNAGSNSALPYPMVQGVGAGGGGGATTGAAGAGGNGANGGGGGGGGSSSSGTAAAGGKGGDGFVSIVEYF